MQKRNRTWKEPRFF